MDKCKKCGSDQMKIGITNTQSGSTIYPMYCVDCGNVSTQYVKKQFAIAYANSNGPLEYVQTSTARWMNENQKQIKCEVCDANEGELHHWAPQYLFEDAEQWPKSYLCRSCHKRWHDLVTPDMSQSNGRQSNSNG